MTLFQYFPNIAKEWHPTKNGDLKPSQVSKGSHKKVWWLCSNYERGSCNECQSIHEWTSIIYNRTKTIGSTCPFCSNHKVCYCQSLEYTFPDIAKEWHPTKNGDLKPSQVSKGSHKKVWWLCLKGCDKCQTIHEWQSRVSSRTTYGTICPFCSKHKVCYCQSLEYTFPDIAKEWHPTKNGDLQSSHVSKSSDIKVWWLCSKCETVSWKTSVSNRTKTMGTNCPNCKINKAEQQLHIICNGNSHIQYHTKLRVRCVDKYNLNKYPDGRLLEPDKQITLNNNHMCIIELDGPQHFYSVNWFGKPTNLQDQIFRDLAKNQYAIDNGWSILRISYEEYHNMEYWLNKFITNIINGSFPIIMYSNIEKYKHLL